MYAGGPSFAHVLWLIGTPGQRRFAELAGGVHDGIRQMFMVIEHARTGCSRCPCRRSAVPGSCRTIPSSSTSGTRRSTACTRAPPPSGAWTCSSKVVRDQGGALRQLLGEITEFAAAESGNGRLKLDRAALARAVAEVEGMLAAMTGFLAAARFCAATVPLRLAAEREVAEQTSLDLMVLPEAAF
jgi:hypothetical protein